MKPATTITKVCRLLGELRTRPCMGVTDLARRTDLLPSDVHRILTSLKPYGFVEQNPRTKMYRLGVGLMKLGLTVLQRNEFRSSARPLLQRLSLQTEATAHMAIYDSQEPDIFLAEQIDGVKDIPFQPKFGISTNPHSTALGKTILANIDHETALRLLDKSGLPRCTPHTITQLAALETELIKISKQGYGLDLEESAEGACCIGAPVKDWTGDTVGAISVSMPANRFYAAYEPDLANMVKATALELSASIGYQPSLTSRH